MKSLDLETRIRACVTQANPKQEPLDAAQKVGSSPKDTQHDKQLFTFQFHEHLRTQTTQLHAGVGSSCGQLAEFYKDTARQLVSRGYQTGGRRGRAPHLWSPGSLRDISEESEWVTRGRTERTDATKTCQ